MVGVLGSSPSGTTGNGKQINDDLLQSTSWNYSVPSTYIEIILTFRFSWLPAGFVL